MQPTIRRVFEDQWALSCLPFLKIVRNTSIPVLSPEQPFAALQRACGLSLLIIEPKADHESFVTSREAARKLLRIRCYVVQIFNL